MVGDASVIGNACEVYGLVRLNLSLRFSPSYTKSFRFLIVKPTENEQKESELLPERNITPDSYIVSGIDEPPSIGINTTIANSIDLSYIEQRERAI